MRRRALTLVHGTTERPEGVAAPGTGAPGAPLTPPPGNAAFIDDLFRRYRSSLKRYLNRLTRDTDASDEIIQETYLRLIRVDKLDRLEARARSYLYSIATNLVRDRWRHDRARLRDKHFSVGDMDFASESPSPEELVDWDRAMAIVRKCLLELQPRCQQTFVLHAVEGLSLAEIAGILGVNRKTAERDFALALEFCQQKLKAVLG